MLGRSFLGVVGVAGYAFVLCSALLVGCGKAELDDSDSNASAGKSAGGDSAGDHGAAGDSVGGDGAGSGNQAGAGVGAPACPDDVPSAAEIRATPRADTNLELFALRYSVGIVADQAIYDRVRRDVTAIHNADAAVAKIDYFPTSDGRSLFLSFETETAAQIASGDYHAWDCLNQTYQKTDLLLMSDKFGSYGTLTLKGIYDIARVAKQYSALPGILSVSPNVGGGDGPTICLTRAGDVWHYVFDQAGGDCVAGCTEHDYHHFSTSLTGQVTGLGSLAPADVEEYASYQACRGD
jgi:hypothetical protein